MRTPAITLRKISFAYHADTVIFRNLNVEIADGSIAVLLGPNGSGKTTLLDMVLGWLQPDAGEVLLYDRNIASYAKRERSRLLCLVPQNDPVYFSLRVLDYVLFGRAPYLPQLGLPKERDTVIAMQALEKVGMLEYAFHDITTLSSGERQLVMLARALSQQPNIMLLDEPTSNLDPGNCDRVLETLVSINASGVTVLFSTHAPDTAVIADTALLIEHPDTIIQGPPKRVITSANLTRLYRRPITVRAIDSTFALIRHGSTRNGN